MHTFRRSALKVLSSPSTTFIGKPRSITTRSAISFRLQHRWTSSPFQRRFASKDAAKPSEATASTETVTETPSKSEQAILSEQSTAADEQRSSVAPAGPSAAVSVQQKASNTATAAPQTAAHATGSDRLATAAVGSEIPQTNVLYVGNLFFEVNEKTLENEFVKYGSIAKTTIVYDQRGLSKGFGYVEFINQADADTAVRNANQQILEGRRMAVQYHRPRPRRDLSKPHTPNEPSKTLFIGNMSFEMSDKDLNDLFREIRNVLDVRVAIDRRSGQPRGFAHADFIDVPSAQRAMEILKDKEIYGRKLRVDYSQSSSRARGV